MPNAIKSNGDGGLALQVTKAARAAGIVEENSKGETTRTDDVRVYAFDSILLVVDIERVSDENIAKLVRVTTSETNSIYRAMDAAVSVAGNGYQVQLPVAEDAGLSLGDEAPCQPAPGLLVIHRDEQDYARLADDLVTIRQSQT